MAQTIRKEEEEEAITISKQYFMVDLIVSSCRYPHRLLYFPRTEERQEVVNQSMFKISIVLRLMTEKSSCHFG